MTAVPVSRTIQRSICWKTFSRPPSPLRSLDQRVREEEHLVGKPQHPNTGPGPEIIANTISGVLIITRRIYPRPYSNHCSPKTRATHPNLGFRGSGKSSERGRLFLTSVPVLGGTWVVISGVFSPRIGVIVALSLLMNPLITTHDPPVTTTL